MLNLFPKTHNTVLITSRLFESLNVKVNLETIEKCLLEHPNYPSILSVSSCLSEMGLKNETYLIPKEEFRTENLLFPFIGSFYGIDNFILIKKIEGETVSIINDLGINETMDVTDFFSKWSGIALHATATSDSGEKDYISSKIKYCLNSLRIPSLIILFSLTLILFVGTSGFSGWYNLALIIKGAGLLVSILLLINSIDANNPLVQNLCSLGKKNNCNAILNSEAAKLTSWLTWSEVGFFYFAGTLITSLLFPSSLPVIIILALLALPYTLYSLSYQMLKKNWCILCCCVQAILWLEAISFYLGGAEVGTLMQQVGNFSFWNVTYYTLSFIAPIVLWSFIKPFLQDASKLKPLQQQISTFKHNSELFNKILQSQPKYSVPQDMMPIILGNQEAEYVITMVSNPYCGPCGQAHTLLHTLFSQRDDLQLKIIFSTSDHDDDPKTKVARHLTALSLVENKSDVEEIIRSWYERKSMSYESWVEKYPLVIDDSVNDAIRKQKDWCKVAEVTHTPTIFINGYKLPSPYTIQDLKYLLN